MLLLVRVVNPIQLPGVLERRRPKEQRIGDGEHRGVRADSQASVSTAVAVNPGVLRRLRTA